MNYNKENINIFKNPQILAHNLAQSFIDEIDTNQSDKFSFALAGGNTPQIFYKTLSLDQYSRNINWNRVLFFWGDERCVSPESNDSNYKMVKESLLNNIEIPSDNIHRIKGEHEPHRETRRYSDLISKLLPSENDLPVFDFILLGLGTDGHTASLFPDSNNLAIKNEVCSVATHPESGQTRITLNLPVIMNARDVVFMVTGKKKSNIIKKILINRKVTSHYPASLVLEKRENVRWFLDNEAGSPLIK